MQGHVTTLEEMLKTGMQQRLTVQANRVSLWKSLTGHLLLHLFSKSAFKHMLTRFTLSTT